MDLTNILLYAFVNFAGLRHVLKFSKREEIIVQETILDMLHNKIWLLEVHDSLILLLVKSSWHLWSIYFFLFLFLEIFWIVRSVRACTERCLLLSSASLTFSLTHMTLLGVLARIRGVMDCITLRTIMATDLARGSHYASFWLDSELGLTWVGDISEIVDGWRAIFLLTVAIAVTNSARRLSAS